MEENLMEFHSRIDLAGVTDKLNRIKVEIGKVIVGQERNIDLILVALLANGHVLLEGVPGVAKTLLAKLFARTINAGFSRVQFTPDLMPSDILGTSVFDLKTSAFTFKKGPVFSNIILIDEINRAPAKTQAALFEVMEERQITIDGQQFRMEPPFLVIATQNPVEHEGTYRLPEAQLDRFLFKIEMLYPELNEEVEILRKDHHNRAEQKQMVVDPVVTGDEIVRMQQVIQGVIVEDNLLEYIARITKATRENQSLYLGGSPRASIALLKASKANAALHGRDFIMPEDIKMVAAPVLQHRVVVAPAQEMEGVTPAMIIKRIVDSIDVPR
ncbi:MAG: MoxR family ATPase [Saprospiraceae bacterium]|nr:MAG: ATPase [Candidatus Parvibacillus calidus]MCC7147992.1 MoxR family ATPase [Saprospiraceae bacterium]